MSLSLYQDIKAASLRTLTSIVHLERTPKLSNIIDCTGTASYHGFLPVLVRNCIQAMIGEYTAPCGESYLVNIRDVLMRVSGWNEAQMLLLAIGEMPRDPI